VADSARFLRYVRTFAVAQSGGVQEAFWTNKTGVTRILETPITIHIALTHYYNENMDRSPETLPNGLVDWLFPHTHYVAT